MSDTTRSLFGGIRTLQVTRVMPRQLIAGFTASCSLDGNLEPLFASMPTFNNWSADASMCSRHCQEQATPSARGIADVKHPRRPVDSRTPPHGTATSDSDGTVTRADPGGRAVGSPDYPVVAPGEAPAADALMPSSSAVGRNELTGVALHTYSLSVLGLFTTAVSGIISARVLGANGRGELATVTAAPA